MSTFEGKRVLITGGTGSLGRILVRRLLGGGRGVPERIVVFSRDEAKQDRLRRACQDHSRATDEIIYRDWRRKLQFRIGDVRDYPAVSAALSGADIVIHAAAMKQVPSCEYAPVEAVKTNILGAENIVRAIQERGLPVEAVLGVSTDKCCKPVSVMGMTKALQERILIQANLRCPKTRFLCVRFGNVLASRGSVVPLFVDQIRRGGPVTLTVPEMTRFFLSLDDAADLVLDALAEAPAGEIWVPRVPSFLVSHIARALIGKRKIETVITGIRPGEKVHEVLVSEEEVHRTVERGSRYAILPILPELAGDVPRVPALEREYSSQTDVMTLERTEALLRRHRMMPEDAETEEAP